MSADGVEISLDVKGAGDPAIIFIHGWSNNKSIWDDQVAKFADKYQVITMDLPGFGESGNNRQKWTMAAFGKDVATVVKKLGLKKVVLVGFSMGGPVVIETANLIPEQVSGVILVDALNDVDLKYPPPVFPYIDSVFMDFVTNPSNEKFVGGGFYKKNTDLAYPRIISMVKDNPKIGWRESLHEILRWQNEDIAKALEKLQVPLVAINADTEPTNVESFKKYVPAFEATIISGTGHVIMWDAPDEFNKALEKNIQMIMK
jgi:pimeloyl-ACP methyl ester carboxylesterase